MSRKLVTLDRLAGLVLAVVLVLLGLALVDWQPHRVVALPVTLRTGAVLDQTSATWWPFVTAVLAVALVLLGLRWVVAHLRRVTRRQARLSESSGAGRIVLDTSSVARAVAATLQSELVLPEANGRVREQRGRPLVQVDARCTTSTDVAELRERAERLTRDMRVAFPSGDVPVRVVVDAPRTRVRDRGRRTFARVQ